MTYKVFVDDNLHFMDASKRHEFDEFPTLAAAIGASKQIVHGYLVSACESGMTADGSPNFFLDTPAAVDSKALATLTVHTFRDVHRAGHRGERQYKSFAKDQTQMERKRPSTSFPRLARDGQGRHWEQLSRKRATGTAPLLTSRCVGARFRNVAVSIWPPLATPPTQRPQASVGVGQYLRRHEPNGSAVERLSILFLLTRRVAGAHPCATRDRRGQDLAYPKDRSRAESRAKHNSLGCRSSPCPGASG